MSATDTTQVRFGFATLFALAWPIVLSRATQAVIGFCDATMVAPYGEDAVAATTTGAMNSLNVFILPMGIVFIVQSVASQLAGAGDRWGARRYGWYGLLVALAAAVLVTLFIPAVHPGLGLLGYTPSVHLLMSDYMVIRFLSCGAVVGTEALGNWYGGLGNTRLPMLVNVVAMVLNVALNWVLIYGNLGAPELGVRGAAIASALASWISFLLIFALFARRRGEGREPRREPMRLAEVGRMLRFGLPNGFNWFLEFAAFSFFVNVIVADLGTTSVAALMAVVQVNSMAFMPAFGMASAGAILVGQAIGARMHDHVPGVVRRTTVITATWQCLVGAFYFLFPGPVMMLFDSPDVSSAALVRLGAKLLAVSAAWQLFDAIAITVSEALRAAGDTAWSLWARIVLAWVVFVPLSYLVVGHWDGGAVGAVLCLVFYLAVLSIALVQRFRSGAWRRIDLTGADLAGADAAGDQSGKITSQ
jgi:MATE family multidrug resistance protein